MHRSGLESTLASEVRATLGPPPPPSFSAPIDPGILPISPVQIIVYRPIVSSHAATPPQSPVFDHAAAPAAPRQLENLFCETLPGTSYASTCCDDENPNELPYSSSVWSSHPTSPAAAPADNGTEYQDPNCQDDGASAERHISDYKFKKNLCASEDLSKSTCSQLTKDQFSFERGFQNQKSAPKLVPSRKAADRDWTREFIAILQKPPLDRGNALSVLSADFVRAARSIAEIIILENNLPYHEQTIRPPPDQKGRAGGIKFFHNGIFFKFAVDSFKIYGGDKFARKACGLELASMSALTPAGLMLGLSFPLTCIIDYLGHRIIAQSILPINSSTLIYGSENRGKQILASDPKMNEIMKQIARMKFIKPHRVGSGSASKELFGPLDIEGHHGLDSYYYLCDVARYFPPESPQVFPDVEARSTSPLPTGRRLQTCYLYRQLRPELLQAYSHPLSSDAYSPFGSHERHAHETEVKQATQFLFTEIIPDLASKLDKITSLAQLALDKQVSSTDGSNSCGLTQFLHVHGVNVRWMGLVYRYMTNENVRILVLQEMICRVLRSEIQSALRSSGLVQKDALIALAVRQFNLIFCGQPEIWLRIRDLLQVKFECSLADDDSIHWFHLRSRLNMFHLFQVLQVQTGVRFAPGAAAALKRHFTTLRQNPNYKEAPFDSFMVLDIRSTVKTMQILPRIEADSLYMQAESAKSRPKDALRLYKLALIGYESSIKLIPSDGSALANLGNVLIGLGQLRYQSSPEESERYFLEAHEKFKQSIEIHRSNISSIRSWINAIHLHLELFLSFTTPSRILGLFTCLDQLYARLVSITRALEREHPSRIFLLSDFLSKWGSSRLQHSRFLKKCSDATSSLLDRVESLLVQSQELFEQSLKFDESNIEARVNLGVSLMDLALLASTPQTDVLFSRAFSIFSAVEEMEGGKGKASYNMACLYGILLKGFTPQSKSKPPTASSDYTQQCRHYLQQSLDRGTLPKAAVVQADPDLSAVSHHKWFQQILDQRARAERPRRLFF